MLTVGTIEPRKNLSGLARAYSRLPEALRRQYPLVVCGGLGWYSERILDTVRSLNLGDSIRLIGFAEHDDMPALYSLATLFVYPSLYEGFGYPPLEAMACGAPVITSNTSSLPEVVGTAAITVDPTDDTDLARQMASVLTDPELRDRLAQQGKVQAGRFRWDTMARDTLAILESAGADDSPVSGDVAC